MARRREGGVNRIIGTCVAGRLFRGGVSSAAMTVGLGVFLAVELGDFVALEFAVAMVLEFGVAVESSAGGRRSLARPWPRQGLSWGSGARRKRRQSYWLSWA